MAQDPEPTDDARAEEAPDAVGVALADAPYPSPDAALVGALAGAQGQFPKIARNHTAEVRGKDGKPGYSYSYADLGDVLAAVRPVLAAHGLAIIQRTIREQGRVVLLTELKHVAGGVLTTEIELGQSASNPQQFGGALTYLRRYELVTLLGIAAEEDRDAQDVEPPGRAAPAAELPGWARPATAQRKRELVAALEVLIGRDRAKALGAAITDTLGVMPDVAVSVAKAIVTHYALEEAGAVEERHRRAHLAELNRQEAQRADVERDAQDAAAEQPDPPPPDEPTPEAEPEPEEVDGELDLEDTVALEAQAAGDDRPAPGTVELPLRGDGESPVAHLKRLRAAGCICPQPLGDVDAPRSIDDACPLNGHGIPF